MTRTGLLGLCGAFALALALGLVLSGCGGSGSSRTPSLLDLLSGKARFYRVPSGSMEPTLQIGDRVVTKHGPPALGEVVIFHPPEGAELQECGPKPHVVRFGAAACAAPVAAEDSSVKFVKRIVAGPGDRLYVHEGHVFREPAGGSRFLRERDGYIRACGAGQECNFPVPIMVPAGYWYLLGDNRGESDDSRFWGPVPAAWIVAVVGSIYYPPQRSGPVAVPTL